MGSLKLPIWIGLRYSRSRSGQRFLSLLSWFSLAGMTLGVAALIIVLSVMNGFQQELRDRILDLIAHGQIEAQGQAVIEDWPALAKQLEAQNDIIAAAPLVGGDVMFSYGKSLQAGIVQGVDVVREQSITPIAERMVLGRFSSLQTTEYGIVLGAALARQLRVYPGDTIEVTLPALTITPFGAKPRVKQFVVVGIFEVGADADYTHAYIRLQDAQKLYGLGDSVQALRFLTRDIMQAQTIVAKLKTQFPHYQLLSWSDQRSALFAAVALEKRMIALMLLLVVLVASCNLVSLLSMMVAKKRDEIAVLSMMGLSPSAVVLIFLTQGLGLSLLGILFGSILGLLIAYNLTPMMHFIEQALHFSLFDPSVFYISGLPSQVYLSDVGYIIAASIVLSIFFSIYPAIQAGKIQAVEALQYQ